MQDPQKNLALILSRELAANLATPMFLIDASGMLVFYNDAAAMLVGRPFTEEIAVAEWAANLDLRDAGGEPIRRRETPPGIAFFDRRPAHRNMRATAFDGADRAVEVTAYPLFGRGDELQGVVTIFWERGEQA